MYMEDSMDSWTIGPGYVLIGPWKVEPFDSEEGTIFVAKKSRPGSTRHDDYCDHVRGSLERVAHHLGIDEVDRLDDALADAEEQTDDLE